MLRNQTFLAKVDISKHQREMMYEPGDHLAIFPENDPNTVNTLISKLTDLPDDSEKNVFSVERLIETKANGE